MTMEIGPTIGHIIRPGPDGCIMSQNQMLDTGAYYPCGPITSNHRSESFNVHEQTTRLSMMQQRKLRNTRLLDNMAQT